MNFWRGMHRDRHREPARVSRCLDPANSPQTVNWAVIDGDRGFVVEELKREVATSLPDSAGRSLEQAVLQEVVAHLETLKNCTARTPEDVRSVATCRDLFELRIHVAVNGLLIRIYFTELADMPRDLVMLLAHVKQVDGLSDERIAELQDERMGEAARRWRAGRANRWGLRP